MSQTILSKAIQALSPPNSRVGRSPSKVLGSSAASVGDVDSSIAKKQMAALEQKILQLKLQLDGVADKSDEWLAGYQNACLAVAVAFAAALIGPKKRSSSAFGHQNP
jgi:hypothetical protein